MEQCEGSEVPYELPIHGGVEETSGSTQPSGWRRVFEAERILMNHPHSNEYTAEEIDQWLRGWALLVDSSSRRLADVRSDLENAAASLDRNSPGHLAIEMRMKGSTKQEIARALGVSITRGASILRDAQEQMARYLRGDGTEATPW